MVYITLAEDIPRDPVGYIYITRGTILTDEELVRACRLALRTLEVECLIRDRMPLLVEAIRGSAIQTLRLNNTQLTDADVVLLAPVLPTLPNLITLDLEYNDFGEVGLLALAAVIPQCPNLVNIEFGGTFYGPEAGTGPGAIVDAIRGRRNFDIPRLQFGWAGVRADVAARYARYRALAVAGQVVLPLLVPGRTPAQIWAEWRDGDHAMMYRVVQFLVDPSRWG